VGALTGTIVGVAEVARGLYLEGALSLAYALGVLVPTAVGLVRRRRFALYATFFVFGVNFLNALLHAVETAGESPNKFGGSVGGLVVFGAIAVLWIRWFVKNRRIFGPATRTARLGDDIYSPGAKRDD
jgi:hypothetical protein